MNNHCITKASRPKCLLMAASLFIMAVQLVFAEGNPVTEVQQALKLKHFYYGDVDGNWDDATQGALRRFQIRNGLPGTGEMDAATLQALTGNPPPAKPTAARVTFQVERASEIARPVEMNQNIPAMRATLNTADVRKPTVTASTREQRAVPNARYSEQFPSWFAQHRGVTIDAIEIRRAIPVTPETRKEQQSIPPATPIFPAASIGGAETLREVVTTVEAHFTGQDGHVYTYYRKIKPPAPDDSKSSAPSYSSREASGSFPLEISNWEENAGRMAHR